MTAWFYEIAGPVGYNEYRELVVDGVTISSTVYLALSGVTPGTVSASKAVIVDANKDIGDFRNLDALNFDAGASGAAGSLDIFPGTASRGKLSISAANSAGDTTTAITNASQAGARTYTIPDAGASASFVMTEGAQTVNGVKTFGSVPVLPTGGLTAGSTTLTETELAYLDGLTLGTVTASKAVTVDANKDAASFRNVTLTGTLAAAAIDGDYEAATLVSNAATLTKWWAVITTEALTTAAGASEVFTLTLPGIVAGAPAFVTRAGGTNTRRSYAYDAVTTADTVTVTVYNTEPANALNGTLVFSLWVVK